MQKSKAEERFGKFVESIKTAKSDYDIAVAGWELVNEYWGFRTIQLARQTKFIIDHIFTKQQFNEMRR